MTKFTEIEVLKFDLKASKACIKRVLIDGWWPDYVYHSEGRWARYSIDNHAVVLEPFTKAEQKILKDIK